MASSVLQTETALDASRWRYRPHLDGLRTVAVMLVILFHSRLAWAGGGFIGVDVFFVLSGFLVSGLLLSEFTGRGSVDLLRFYARRVRRLLPASLVTLLVVAWVTSQVVAPLTASNLRADFVSAALYVSNWNFIARASDYFATELDQSPVLHFWSLSVEEQFYLLWPAVLVGLLVWGRKRCSNTTRWLPWVVAGIAAASFLLALVASQDSISRAYYGTDVRIYQLLAGATLAVVVTKRRLPEAPAMVWRVVAVLGAALLIGASLGAVSLDPIKRGGVATVATVAIIAGLEQLPGQPLGRLLSRPAAVDVGRISYGMYLWHWPIALVVLDGWSIGPGLGALLITSGAVAAAWTSNKLVEWPIRSSAFLGRHNGAVIATGLGASVAAALLMWFVILQGPTTPTFLTEAASDAPPTASTAPAEAGEDRSADPNDDPERAAVAESAPTSEGEVEAAVGRLPVGPLLDPAEAAADTAEAVNCIERPIGECLVVDGEGPDVLVVGDSHGIVMLPAFQAMAEQHGFRLSASLLSACPWSDVRAERDGVVYDECDRFRRDTYERIVPELAPDVVVLVNRALYWNDILDGSTIVKRSDEGFTDAAMAGVNRVLDILESAGPEVLVMGRVPEIAISFPECLSGAGRADECDIEVRRTTALDEALQAEVEARPRMAYVDINEVVCPAYPVCNAVVDDIITRSDKHHLTVTYARAISAQVYAAMAEAAVSLAN